MLNSHNDGAVYLTGSSMIALKTYGHLELCSVAVDCSILSSQSVVTQWDQLPGKTKPSAIWILVGWCHPLTNSLTIQNLDRKCKFVMRVYLSHSDMKLPGDNLHCLNKNVFLVMSRI